MAMIEQRLEQAAHDQDGEGDRYGNAALLREAAKVIGEMRAALAEILPTSKPMDGTAVRYNEWHAKISRAKAALARANREYL